MPTITKVPEPKDPRFNLPIQNVDYSKKGSFKCITKFSRLLQK